MKLIGYIPPISDYSFCIPIYTDRKKRLYYHKTDNYFCISGFDNMNKDIPSFIPYKCRIGFNIGDFAPILFYTREEDKFICDKADKAIIKICDILYKTDKPRKYTQQEVLSVEKELGINLNYYKVRFQMNNYAYEHFPYDYKQIREIQSCIDELVKKNKSNKVAFSKKTDIENNKIKNMQYCVVKHANDGNMTGVIKELHHLVKYQSKIGSIEGIYDSLTKISTCLKSTQQTDFTGMFTLLSSHFAEKKPMLGDKYTKLKEKYESRRRRYPYFKSGDTITVAYREEKLDTIRQFRGVVIKLGGIGINKRFTVRKISDNAGVERIFPLESPLIDNITVNKTGKIRKAKLYYLRGLAAKKARAKKDKYISRFQSRKQ